MVPPPACRARPLPCRSRCSKPLCATSRCDAKFILCCKGDFLCCRFLVSWPRVMHRRNWRPSCSSSASCVKPLVHLATPDGALLPEVDHLGASDFVPLGDTGGVAVWPSVWNGAATRCRSSGALMPQDDAACLHHETDVIGVLQLFRRGVASLAACDHGHSCCAYGRCRCLSRMVCTCCRTVLKFVSMMAAPTTANGALTMTAAAGGPSGGTRAR